MPAMEKNEALRNEVFRKRIDYKVVQIRKNLFRIISISNVATASLIAKSSRSTLELFNQYF